MALVLLYWGFIWLSGVLMGLIGAGLLLRSWQARGWVLLDWERIRGQWW